MKNFIFTKDNWVEEVRESLDKCEHSALGSCWKPCPNCQHVGFYSWRDCTNKTGFKTRTYRACKFCGFWQESDGEPYFCEMTHCDKCNAYDWVKPGSQMAPACANCFRQGTYFVNWPVKDQGHIFWKIKGNITARHNGLQLPHPRLKNSYILNV